MVGKGARDDDGIKKEKEREKGERVAESIRREDVVASCGRGPGFPSGPERTISSGSDQREGRWYA